MALCNAMLQGKLKGTQCSETVKSRVSIIIIMMICMKLRFSSCLSKSWALGVTRLCQSTALLSIGNTGELFP